MTSCFGFLAIGANPINLVRDFGIVRNLSMITGKRLANRVASGAGAPVQLRDGQPAH